MPKEPKNTKKDVKKEEKNLTLRQKILKALFKAAQEAPKNGSLEDEEKVRKFNREHCGCSNRLIT